MANDHYVPQFYLKGFEILTKPKWIYSYKRKLKPKAIAIKSVASEEGYYKIEKDDLTIPEDTVDKIFSIIESDVAPIISRLRTDPALNLSKKEKGALSMFIALLAFRTPFARTAMKNLDAAQAKRELKRQAADKEEFHRTSKRIEPDTPPEKIEEYRLMILNFDENFTVSHMDEGENEFYFMGQGVAIAQELAHILFDKHWSLIESDNSRPF
jgi:DNA polymerase III delta prime subunit